MNSEGRAFLVLLLVRKFSGLLRSRISSIKASDPAAEPI